MTEKPVPGNSVLTDAHNERFTRLTQDSLLQKCTRYFPFFSLVPVPPTIMSCSRHRQCLALWKPLSPGYTPCFEKWEEYLWSGRNLLQWSFAGTWNADRGQCEIFLPREYLHEFPGVRKSVSLNVCDCLSTLCCEAVKEHGDCMASYFRFTFYRLAFIKQKPK